MNIIERSRDRLGFDKKTYQRLIDILVDPDRHYHGLSHVAYMLDLFEKHGLTWMMDRDARSVELAIWFHDIVYDSKAKDNEEQSAQFACEALSLSEAEAECLTARILATKSHTGPTLETQFLIDLDLAILGDNEHRYRRYARDVRKEYSWVSDEDYRSGRIAVLNTFIKRDILCPLLSEQIYGKVHVLRDQARNNMRNEITLLMSDQPDLQVV